MLVLGLISEGPTDAAVIGAVLSGICSDFRIHPVHPELDESGIMQDGPNEHGYGWRGIKAFCEAIHDNITEFLASIASEPLDGLLIHVDCSMAHNVGAEHSCPSPLTTANALSEVIQGQWLSLTVPRSDVLVITPSKEIEAWIVAGLCAPRARMIPIECDFNIAAELIGIGLVKRKNGELKKSQRKYIDKKADIATAAYRIINGCETAKLFHEQICEFHKFKLCGLAVA